MRLYAIVLVVGLFTFSGSAFAGGAKVSVFGDGTLSHTVTTGVTNQDSKLGFGGGAQIEFGLGPMAGLEIGAIYLSRKQGATGAVTTTTYLQFPLQLRYWVGRYLTLGAGGYYAMGIGKIKNELAGEFDFATAAVKKGDYGLLGSLGFNIPMGGSAAFFAEGRFAYGLADINDPAVSGVTSKWQDIQMLAGLRFGMGK